MNYETNFFRIINLEKLTANYVLFEITGLNEVDDDFDNNIQFIVKKLSYFLKHPVTTINKSGKPFLVVKNETEILLKVPSEFLVKREDIVYFKQIDEVFNLDFTNYTEATKLIILRFLQFDVQTEMNKNPKLWQPGSGEAFFSKDAAEIQGDVSIFNGFLVRAVELPMGGFGFAVDVTKKYIATNPLKVNLTRAEFKNQGIKKSHLVYQYGNNRYEIRPDEFSDLSASKYKFKRPSDGEVVTLLEDTKDKFKDFMPPMVANLPDDAAVLIYKTNDDQERRVIAGLCYKVYDTEDPQVMKLHKKSIIIPFYRRKLVRTVFHNYFKDLLYGRIKLEMDPQPVIVKRQVFTAPDILFGNDTTLSVRGTKGAIPVTIENLGRKRKHLLSDVNVGFYTQATFEKQYFVIPETIFNMYGSEKYFLNHLIEQVDKMHPTEKGWKPEIITYDNRNKKNAVDIGFEILQKIKESTKGKNGGYAVVMLPSGVERIKRQHDDLAALVVSECLGEYNITASIMHSNTLDECYLHRTDNGKSTYFVKRELQGKYMGYVSGVATNQVLLNNERWPYVLNTPLHADITIGIDVKKQIAGFTFVDKDSKNILTRFDKSNNKEKLSAAQMIKMLVRNIELLATYIDYPINNIVVHRDGRLFQSEKNGIVKAMDVLKERKTLTSNCNINIIEIPKHSIIPFRLFEVTKEYNIYQERSDNRNVLNPQIGSFLMINKKEAFVCTTGREFNHGGSSNPLYIKYESGNMSLENILEDLYFLSCLAFTKPDDCSRFPITIKITDRRINTLGSNFELEELDILRSEFF